MASMTKTAGEAAGAGAAGRRHTAGPEARTESRGKARKRGSTRPTAGRVARHDARARVTLAGDATGSRGIGLADQSDWWLDPCSPSQVTFAPRGRPRRAASDVGRCGRRSSVARGKRSCAV
jgi:hypothetical protein